MSSHSMILYGRQLSPFTRRVLIWARLQGHQVDHRPIQVVGPEYEELKAKQGTGRVPLLITSDGETMVDSWAICDWLESVAPAEKRLLPTEPTARRATTQTLALAHSMAEKAVAYVYESQRRPENLRWSDWAERLQAQSKAAMDLLEARCPADGFIGGAAPNGADVMAACAHGFVETTNAALLETGAVKLSGVAARMNAIEVVGATHPQYG